MARKSTKIAKEEVVAVPEPINRTYTVVERFTGNINNHVFDQKVGDLITLTDFEYRVLKRFLKEE